LISAALCTKNPEYTRLLPQLWPQSLCGNIMMDVVVVGCRGTCTYTHTCVQKPTTSNGRQ